jgi:hypothetical protein
VNEELRTDPKRVRAALEFQIHQGDRYVPFGDITPDAAREQAERLGNIGTWGPLQRVAKVAQAWKLLAAQMERDGAATVRELEPATVVDHAERVWVTPPEGGLVEGMRG